LLIISLVSEYRLLIKWIRWKSNPQSPTFDTATDITTNLVNDRCVSSNLSNGQKNSINRRLFTLVWQVSPSVGDKKNPNFAFAESCTLSEYFPSSLFTIMPKQLDDFIGATFLQPACPC